MRKILSLPTPVLGLLFTGVALVLCLPLFAYMRGASDIPEPPAPAAQPPETPAIAPEVNKGEPRWSSPDKMIDMTYVPRAGDEAVIGFPRFYQVGTVAMGMVVERVPACEFRLVPADVYPTLEALAEIYRFSTYAGLFSTRKAVPIPRIEAGTAVRLLARHAIPSVMDAGTPVAMPAFEVEVTRGPRAGERLFVLAENLHRVVPVADDAERRRASVSPNATSNLRRYLILEQDNRQYAIDQYKEIAACDSFAPAQAGAAKARLAALGVEDIRTDDQKAAAVGPAADVKPADLPLAEMAPTINAKDNENGSATATMTTGHRDGSVTVTAVVSPEHTAAMLGVMAKSDVLPDGEATAEFVGTPIGPLPAFPAKDAANKAAGADKIGCRVYLVTCDLGNLYNLTHRERPIDIRIGDHKVTTLTLEDQKYINLFLDKVDKLEKARRTALRPEAGPEPEPAPDKAANFGGPLDRPAPETPRKPEKPAPARARPAIRVLDNNWKVDDGGNFVTVTLMIQNMSKSDMKMLNVEIIYKDSNDHLINSSSCYVGNFEGGETRTVSGLHHYDPRMHHFNVQCTARVDGTEMQLKVLKPGD